jgi:radical SAM superfamily enzyme YgiQ (UPF0313 family)
MRVAGIYPLLSPTDVDVRGSLTEPVGLGKVLAVAKKAGAEEILYEMLVGDNPEDMAAQVESFDPDIVAFSLMTCQMPVAEAMASHLKRRRSDRVIVAGGYHPSAMERATSPFDAFFVGEGEASFESFITSVRRGEDWTQGPGLLLRHSRTPLPPRLINLDAYPWPLRNDRMLAEKCLGLVYPPPSQQTGFAFVEYGRGCKFSCKFCCKESVWPGRSMVFREPAQVVKEMSWLQREKQVNLFIFADLNFTVSRPRVLALCEEMKRSGFTGSWFCLSNIATARGDVLEAMAEAGCNKVMYGIESTDNRTLRLMNKRQVYEQEAQAVRQTLDCGMVPHLFYIVGFPWETRDSILSCVDRLRNLDGLQLRLQIATPLPGSRWYEEMQGRISTRDFGFYDCEHLVFRHPHFREPELRELIDRVYRLFYETGVYRRRVEQFLGKWPQYKTAFGEFFALLRDERGIDVGVLSAGA